MENADSTGSDIVHIGEEALDMLLAARQRSQQNRSERKLKESRFSLENQGETRKQCANTKQAKTEREEQPTTEEARQGNEENNAIATAKKTNQHVRNKCIPTRQELIRCRRANNVKIIT